MIELPFKERNEENVDHSVITTAVSKRLLLAGQMGEADRTLHEIRRGEVGGGVAWVCPSYRTYTSLFEAVLNNSSMCHE